MDLLYQKHFGFSQAPFNITPVPEFLYLSDSHREALAQLSYGVKARKGFVVLTGEVGTGKTTLVHALLNELNGSCQTALIFSSVFSPVDLLRSVCEEFGLVEPQRPLQEIHDYLVSLNDFLLKTYRKGANCALIIDEAQNLSAAVLESVRLLSNFETSKDKLLQILLVGQPELSARLNSQELRQLKQRVTVRYHLRALTLKECQAYISSRLQVAGGDPMLFTSKAVELIYACSAGIPRVINVICDGALITAYGLRKTYIDDFLIRQVAEDLQIGGTVFSGESLSRITNETIAPMTNEAPSQPEEHSKPIPEQPPVVKVAESAGTRSGVVPRIVFDELSVILIDAM